MTINKRLYKKDTSIQFVVKRNRNADGVSKSIKRKYRRRFCVSASIRRP
ncbi:hypothetical protein [Exiguobacterium flavidum]|nr:hypothetical protein [Exiguobacterium flavidum]